MTIAEYMRIGISETAPLTNGELFDTKRSKDCTKACALGCIAVGAKLDCDEEKDSSTSAYVILPNKFSILNERIPIELYPKQIFPFGKPDRLLEIIYRMNDSKEFSRKEVADWVEKVEQELTKTEN